MPNYPSQIRYLLERVALSLQTLAAVLVAGCASVERIRAPAARVDAPAIAVGDRWVYDEINAYNGRRVGQVAHEVKRIEPDGRLILSVKAQGSLISALAHGGDEVDRGPWIVERDAVFDMSNAYQPGLPLLAFPLSEGEWRSDTASSAEEPGKPRGPWQVHTRVGPWERVRVPAGEFVALRVERRIWFLHPDIFRDRSHRVDTLWYAPEVGRWVKREWTGFHTSRYSPLRGVTREDWVRWELREFRVAETAQRAHAAGNR